MHQRLAATMSVTLFMLAVGCWLSGETMSSTELDRIKDQAEVLRMSGSSGDA